SLAGRDAPGGGGVLEPRAGVDGVSDQRVRDIPFAADLTQHDLAAVNADTHAWPVRVLGGHGRELRLEREGRACGPERVIGLVAATVERGHDAVADELLDLAAEAPREQRRSDAPVRIEHLCDDCGRRAVGERRESDEIAEENADVLLAVARAREIKGAKTLLAPLPP